ncbi:MAG: hypothetical protein PVJ43_05975 [Gemmatimonadales bacterium]|jgi:hypothetical protein
MRLADPQEHEALEFYPLVDPQPRQLRRELLRDAWEAGKLTIGEVGTGKVPELQFENRSGSDVLVLDGEQLIGAKQNRLTNRTIQLSAHSTTTIPVSCMEQGRWHFQSREFRHGDHCSPAGLRRVARRTEATCAAESIAASPEVLSCGQADVWDEISSYESSLGERSTTGALNDLYGHRALDLEQLSRHFPSVDDQIGLLAFLGGEPLGMDVIGCHRLYARLHKRLVSGYVMDALTMRGSRARRRVDAAPASEFLHKVQTAERTDAPTVGCGTYRVLTDAVLGGELEVTREMVHLSAFPRHGDSTSDGPPLSRAHRRRWRSRTAD